MDTRFSSAIHTLIMIAGSDAPLTSEIIARSVGTNASYIRRLTGLLKKSGIIESHRGIGGFSLLQRPEDLTLYAIYQAISDTQQVHVFDLHRNPSDACVVGRYIQPVLAEMFRGIEEQAERELKRTTLADCIRRMQDKLGKSGCE